MTEIRLGVVVGASGGIGSACATALADSADRLVLVDRRPAIETARIAGAEECVADIVTPEGRAAVRAAVKGARGQLGWVVLASGEPLRQGFQTAPSSAVERCLLVNLVAPVLLVRELLEFTWEANGQVIVVGSISTSRALPNRAVYAAAKAGLEHFARSLAAELAGRELRCNIVAPGVIDTDFLGEDRTALDGWVQARVPMRRLGNTTEVAQVVRFLVRDAPPYLSGARIAVDGATEALG